jgi:8-oxo-dGTP pyrophosphatase MutT (NUDIX family)
MTPRNLLRDELTAYAPSAAELAAYDRLGLLLAESGDPLSAAHFDPGHVTAGGLVLSPDRERVLLVHHRTLDRWLGPGGHVDPGDASVMAAAEREVLEETGVAGVRPLAAGIVDVDAHRIPAKGSHPPHTHFNVLYAFTAVSDELHPSPEVRDAVWQPLERVAELSDDTAVLRGTSKLGTIAGRRGPDYLR